MNTYHLRRTLNLLLLLCFALFFQLTLKTPARADVVWPLYVPMTLNGRGIHIWGEVTLNGVPAENEPIDLDVYDGQWTTPQSTLTDAAGVYSFTVSADCPCTYLVVYRNPASVDNGRLRFWKSVYFGATAPATHVDPFEIGNVELLAPAPGTTADLPVAFQWKRREVPTDIYALDLCLPDGDFWWSPTWAGYTDTYTLPSLPCCVPANTPVEWRLHIYHSVSHSSGQSGQSAGWVITFANNGSAKSFSPTAPPRLSLDAWRLVPRTSPGCR